MAGIALAELEPRLRAMLELIVSNRAAICEPKKGVLELHFNGKHVSAHLVGHQVLRADEQEQAG